MKKGSRDNDIAHHNLFYTMPLGVVYQNAEGKIISANPAAEKILGITLDQMTGRTSMDPRWRAIHEDGSEFVGETHPSVMALRTGKKIKNVVMGIFNPRMESYRWITINAVPEFRGGESKPYQVYSTFEDITEQKHAIEAMKESEERYRQIFSIAPAAIYEVDYRTGKIISVNDTISEYTGYTEDELLSMNALDLLSEESQAIFLQRLGRVLRGETVPEKVQYVARKKDGTQFTASLNTRFVYEGDEIVGATVVAQDITELSEVDLALRKSEERYRFIVDNIEDVIWTMDMNFNLTYVSPSIFKQRGFTVEEVMEQSLEETLLPDSLNEVLKLLNEKLALIDRGDEEGFKFVQFETEQPCKDGSVIWTSNRARIMPNPDRKAASMLGVTRDITEQKRAEERLKASEESLRNIINASPMGIHMYEVRDQNQLVFIGSNAAADRILGVKHDQFIGKTIEEAFPGLMDTEVPTRYRDAATNGKSWRTEQIHYDEGQIRGAFEVVAFQTEPGKMAALFNEITSRKQAEAVLKESESRLRGILDGVDNIPVQGYDSNRTVIYWNTASEKVYGYNRQEAIGRKLEDLMIPGEMREKVIEDFDTWVNSGRQIPAGELTLCDKNGNPVPVYSSHVMHTDAAGNKEMFRIDVDLRQLRSAEKAMRESEQRYRSLVENTMDGYFICEIPSGRFIFLNQRACDLFGYEMEEGLRLSVWDVMEAEDHPRIRKRIQERVQGKPPSSERQTYTAVRKDGSTFRAEISTSLVRYSTGPAVQGILRDITEHERLHLQFQQAQKFEAIGTLAGGIAHDFNNLLMGIQGRASLMTVESDSVEEQREHIEAIEDYVRSATHLTKQLLGFSRGGKYEVKPFDLNALLVSSAAMFGRTRKEIQIHTNTQAAALIVEADPRQIEQVLLNLFVNAWQAMPGGGDLYLETTEVYLNTSEAEIHQLRPGRYGKLMVADTGVGMDDATKQQVFDPFFTTKDKSRGTGLGLASAYGIVKNHRGMITVQSRIGQGATFTILLPLSEKPLKQEKPANDGLKIGSENILLVDDEQIILDVTKAMLEKLGYQVVVAKSGKEAIDRVAKLGDTIDLVILDLIMPGMDGGSVFEKMKQMNSQIPVILASGYAINGQANEIMKKGCKGFIQKPFNLVELSQKIRQILTEGKRPVTG